MQKEVLGRDNVVIAPRLSKAEHVGSVDSSSLDDRRLLNPLRDLLLLRFDHTFAAR